MSRTVWAVRRARAAHLMREAPHAEEILVFYVELTRAQERVAGQLTSRGGLSVPHSSDGVPPLRPDLLPVADILPLFDGFLADMAGVGTDVIMAECQAWLDAAPGPRKERLTDADGFHPRAFVQAVATTLAAGLTVKDGGDSPSQCRMCGSRPVAGTLRDLPDALGARGLVCSLCATEWRMDRLRCVQCGETAADSLRVHAADSIPWVRLDECLSCRCYLKTVDLRQRGDAVPVVDELATVELDLWAADAGLTKLQTNLLDL